MVRLVYRPALVLHEELHVAISVPCSDKFTVPQHAHRHVHAHPEASLALAVKHVPIVHAHLQAARTTGVSGYLMAAILPKASSTSFLTCGL